MDGYAIRAAAGTEMPSVSGAEERHENKQNIAGGKWMRTEKGGSGTGGDLRCVSDASFLLSLFSFLPDLYFHDVLLLLSPCLQLASLASTFRLLSALYLLLFSV